MPTIPHSATNTGRTSLGARVGYPIDQLVQGPPGTWRWVGEKPGYNAQTNTCTPVPPLSSCGHYTQIIWGAPAREVGCGTASGTEIVILVCHYNPPGNMAGQTPFSRGPAQAVGEEDISFPPPQEGVGGGDGGDTSGGGDGGDTSGGGDGGDTSGGGDGDAN